MKINSRGLNDTDTLLTRNQEFLLKNENKQKCVKIFKDVNTNMQCGPGGLVRFQKSDSPDPTNPKLKKSPGSVNSPTKNADPCGPLLKEPVQFDFAKNASVNDLYVTYIIN